MAEPHSALDRLEAVRDLTVTMARKPALLGELPRWARARQHRRDPLGARQPWWNFQAIDVVASRLQPGARTFEYGGGGSTLWLLDRGCVVRTVEHDRAWHADLMARLQGRNAVDLIEAGEDFSSYVDAIDSDPDRSLDLVIVDGRERVRCGLAAREKVRPGGMLLLDDADRPRYQALHEALTGWSAQHLIGLKNGDWAARQTTIWTRPGEK